MHLMSLQRYFLFVNENSFFHNSVLRPKNESTKEQNETSKRELIRIEIHQSSRGKIHIIYFIRKSYKKLEIENISYSSSENLAGFCNFTEIFRWKRVKFIDHDDKNRVKEFILQFTRAGAATKFWDSLISCSASFADHQDLHKTSKFSSFDMRDEAISISGLKYTEAEKKVIDQLIRERYRIFFRGFFHSTRKYPKLEIRVNFLKVLHKSLNKSNILFIGEKSNASEWMKNEVRYIFICYGLEASDRILHLIATMQFLFDSFFSKIKEFSPKFETSSSSLKDPSQISIISIGTKNSQDNSQILIYMETNSILLHGYTELQKLEFIHQRTGTFFQISSPRFLSVILRRSRSPKRNDDTTAKFGTSTESHPNYYKRSASSSSSKSPRQKKSDSTASQDSSTKTSPLKVDVSVMSSKNFKNPAQLSVF